ncbi:uncharacterized protein LOC8027826 [Ixodes scapularis]|uniref:Uncharacterized protein n=1 Tax=Ixodes scapularis TaxID=6945 RepID=B7PCD9_IXOSC|nr:uncharacterized protein LOC8027826 [Ixodes scapularis]EEC04261.1 hypothetical protein IscW_ISCW002076 [Ixodes scapularis]|eukprot:XP_002409703.1 hypothetical protein IscW_ISCW002076 [Ixodes scapularis]
MLSWMITRKRELECQDQALRREQEANALEYEMKRRALQRDLQDRRRLAATRGTVLCIVGCGLALAALGVALTCVGLLLRGGPFKAPCTVAGPTCVVMGFLVLLLSVETIIKCRRAQRFQQSDSKETLLERALHKAHKATKDTNVDDATAVTAATSNSIVLNPQRLAEPLEMEETKLDT